MDLAKEIEEARANAPATMNRSLQDRAAFAVLAKRLQEALDRIDALEERNDREDTLDLEAGERE